jgi:cytochrome o ubiquinol oxidase subunit 2
MNSLLRVVAFVLIVVAALLALSILLDGAHFPVLDPSGIMAMKERDLIVFSMGLMLSIAIPVVLITYFVAWKYRASNTKATYAPTWTGNNLLKSSYWLFLGSLVILFGVVVWKAAHELDPYKPLASANTPITIQVVALEWKWLFIYPEQHIATVNYVAFPVNTPVTFKLTADAPMNSFWIPSLSGQIYAMAAMETQIHMMANKIGDYPGGAAEINGSGYAGMRFVAHASSQADFDTWVEGVKKSPKTLDLATYNKLSEPSEYTPATYYSTVDKDLYNSIMMKYMKPTTAMHEDMHE